MDPVQPLKTPHGDGDHDRVDATSWVSVCPRGLWRVQKKKIPSESQQTVTKPELTALCSSGCCPTLGSLCRVQVHLKDSLGETDNSESDNRKENLAVKPEQSVAEELVATAFPRCLDSVLQVPLGDWTVLRLGEGQCDITEACLAEMRAGEKCEIQLSPVEDGSNAPVPQPAEELLPLCATIELQSFTPGRESWEMSPGEKWEWVKSHKERGGVRFRSGDVWGAADSYSRSLKLLIPLYGLIRVLEKTDPDPEREAEEQRGISNGDERNQLPSVHEFKTIKAELHSNMSLCQLKLSQPVQAKASATKAAELEPGGAKAWYRLGQACLKVNELEEAKHAFRKLLKLQPDSPAALKALKDIASREKETNVQLGQRLSKMFS
ncbi:FK506-binding protein-like [Echeneis naucrates]|uniref:Uncharacterized protein n=1 Tax=Echeneis naucrates TaxID=173247 RepID=A0A665U4P6_ECHNA|nr:FK506-binding protein-like [Echeneis naucrates]XP_029361590.1 FK506-binding protein-like [Echeneis naucrates]